MFGWHMEREKVDIPLSLSSTSMATYGYVTFAAISRRWCRNSSVWRWRLFRSGCFRLFVVVCLIFTIPLHAARRATAAAPPLPSRRQPHFSAFKPIPAPNSLRVKPGLPDLLETPEGATQPVPNL